MSAPRHMSPWVPALGAWLLATLLSGPVLFFLVLVLAGPHGGVLPSRLAPVVLLAAWAVLIGVPVLVARRVFARARRG
jgi:hypothetical protein